MKLEHLIAVAVRLFAIALVIYLLRNSIGALTFISGTNFSFTHIAYIGTIVSLVLISIVLWKFPLLVARKISDFPAAKEEELVSPEFEKLLRVGLIIVGIYLMFYVVSDLLYWGITWMALQRDTGSNEGFNFEQKVAVFITILEFAIAVYLILGNRVLAKFIWLIQYGARN